MNIGRCLIYDKNWDFIFIFNENWIEDLLTNNFNWYWTDRCEYEYIKNKKGYIRIKVYNDYLSMENEYTAVNVDNLSKKELINLIEEYISSQEKEKQKEYWDEVERISNEYCSKSFKKLNINELKEVIINVFDYWYKYR